jgi:hypothetical protein
MKSNPIYGSHSPFISSRIRTGNYHLETCHTRFIPPDQTITESLLNYGRIYADAAPLAARPLLSESLLFSIALAQQNQIRTLLAKIEHLRTKYNKRVSSLKLCFFFPLILFFLEYSYALYFFLQVNSGEFGNIADRRETHMVKLSTKISKIWPRAFWD